MDVLKKELEKLKNDCKDAGLICTGLNGLGSRTFGYSIGITSHYSKITNNGKDWWHGIFTENWGTQIEAISDARRILDRHISFSVKSQNSQNSQNNSPILQFLSFAEREIETCNKNSKIFRDLGNFKTASDIESNRIGIISCRDAVNFFVKNGRFPEENETF